MAYFYQEELGRHYLSDQYSVVTDFLAKHPVVFNELTTIAKNCGVKTTAVILSSQNLKLLIERAVPEADRQKKLRDWPNFAANAAREWSDEAVFATAHTPIG